MTESKVCPKCKKDLLRDKFGTFSRGGKRFSRAYCRQCESILQTRWARENPDKVWGNRNPEARVRAAANSHLKRKYGVTLDWYEDQVKQRDGNCDMCHKVPSKALCVDHEHATGRIRGLLCDKCNIALGLFGDNVETIKRAITYVAN